ncbi:hypothetical protein ACUHMQ_20570 [Chitinimonas sp. PSY-7]|uniref:hypothetical protein n=1 Tax=Chitinimonas sp. PSY-7 TaxID=3459088 RepID=UPI00403FEB0B
MAETINIGEIAQKLSKEIFKYFLWSTHQKHDDNFKCTNPDHKSEGKTGKSKETHPGDVVFSYDDPYAGKTIYLHTDLKSYSSQSITSTKLRSAFKSLSMTVECAQETNYWREKYSVPDDEAHEVRGLLFVHNHDHKYTQSFADAVSKMDLQNLPLPAGALIHYLGPSDIQRLYNIGNDIIRLQNDGELPKEYTYYYPDLVMVRRHGDGTKQAATIESMTGPFLILRHGEAESCSAGYLIYYNRPGNLSEEFEYFLDCLSRFQMLEGSQLIRIRMTDGDAIDNLKSVFQMAKKKYARAWGFDPAREEILEKIKIDRITTVTNTYSPGDMGWRE